MCCYCVIFTVLNNNKTNKMKLTRDVVLKAQKKYKEAVVRVTELSDVEIIYHYLFMNSLHYGLCKVFFDIIGHDKITNSFKDYVNTYIKLICNRIEIGYSTFSDGSLQWIDHSPYTMHEQGFINKKLIIKSLNTRLDVLKEMLK